MRCVVVLLFAIAAVRAQDSPLALLKLELKTASEQASRAKAEPQTPEKEGESGARIARVHTALRSWIESRLPVGKSASSIKASNLEAVMRAELGAAGIAVKNIAYDPNVEPESLNFELSGFDAVAVTLAWKPELPDVLFITAGVAVLCGTDEAVYGYRFDAYGWALAFNDRSKSDSGYGFSALELSEPDFKGLRLLLIQRSSVQCASTWMSTSYSVSRLGLSEQPVDLLLSDRHGFWLGNDGPEFVLKPDELIIELLDSSVDGNNRTHILRYSFANGTKRIEPLAFQPQDFAEEWLTRPWSEMKMHSAPETQQWHGKLRANQVFADYTSVVACEAKPDRWSVGFEISRLGEKELAKPITAYFLVRDLGNYRFQMEAVSDSSFAGCPGEGAASEKHPWLSVEQLKALP